MQEELILKSYNYFKRAKELLEDSLMNYEPFRSQKDYTEEELKSYDALSFRFVKFVEMALSLMIAKVELARELLSESILFENKVLEALGEKNLSLGG